MGTSVEDVSSRRKAAGTLLIRRNRTGPLEITGPVHLSLVDTVTVLVATRVGAGSVRCRLSGEEASSEVLLHRITWGTAHAGTLQKCYPAHRLALGGWQP